MDEINEDERFETLLNPWILNEKSLELIFKKLHEQTIKWMHPRRIFLTWGIFFINDGSKIDNKMSQITMCYVVCYKCNPINPTISNQ